MEDKEGGVEKCIPRTGQAVVVQSPFIRLLSPCVNILKVCGIFYSDAAVAKPRLRIVHNIFASVVFILSLLAFSIELPFLPEIPNLNKMSTFDICRTVWIFLSTDAFVMLIFWDRKSKLSKIDQLLSDATQQRGIRKNCLSLRRLQVCILIVSVGFFITTLAFYTIMLSDSSLLPVAKNIFNRWGLWLNIPRAIVGMYHMTSWTVSIVITLSMCACIAAEFKDFNSRLEKEEFRCGDAVALVRHYAAIHTRLVKVVHAADATLHWYMLVQFSCAVPLTVLNIYGLLLGVDNMTAILVYWLFVVLTAIFALSFYSAKISEYAKEPKVIINMKLGEFDSQACNRQMTTAELYSVAGWFANHVESDHIGISIGSVLIISKKLILTVLSLMVSYLAILIPQQSGGYCNRTNQTFI